MENNNMFEDIFSEELYDIDGGSTKVAAVVLAIGAAATGVGSYAANKTGHPVAASYLGGASSTCALAAAWCAFAPCI